MHIDKTFRIEDPHRNLSLHQIRPLVLYSKCKKFFKNKQVFYNKAQLVHTKKILEQRYFRTYPMIFKMDSLVSRA